MGEKGFSIEPFNDALARGLRRAHLERLAQTALVVNSRLRVSEVSLSTPDAVDWLMKACKGATPRRGRQAAIITFLGPLPDRFRLALLASGKFVLRSLQSGGRIPMPLAASQAVTTALTVERIAVALFAGLGLSRIFSESRLQGAVPFHRTPASSVHTI